MILANFFNNHTFVLGFFLWALAQSAQAQDAGVYYWYDGDVRHEVHLRMDLAAELNPSPSAKPSDTSSKASANSGNVIREDRTVRIVRLNRSSNASGKLSSGQSPVFSDASESGTLRTLPGGIVVTFKEVKSTAQVQAWALANSLELEKILPVKAKTIATFKTAPGLPSLEEANRVRSLSDILSAEPNWWTEKWKNPVNSESATQSGLRSRSARERASQGFSAD